MIAIESLRRLLLATAILAALLLEWWTVEALVLIGLPTREQDKAAVLQVPGAAWEKLHGELQDAAMAIPMPAAWEARLSEGDRFMARSTLRSSTDPSFFRYFFRVEEIPGALLARLQPDTAILIQTQGGGRLVVSLKDRPARSGAPDAMVHSWSDSTRSGWIVVVGIGAYFVLGMFRKNGNKAITPRLLAWQSLLGFALVSGFGWFLLLKADPSSKIIEISDPSKLAGWIGLSLGALTLLSASRRTSAGTPVVLSPGSPPGESAQVDFHTWISMRLMPALPFIAALGFLAGFLRMGTGFFVGLQGLFLGMALGGSVGYFGLKDPEHSWKISWCWLAALAAALIFLVGQGFGANAALAKGNIFQWLGGILDGTLREPFFGYRRYSLGLRAFEPGPIAWLLFNLLDLAFMVFMAFLIIRVVNAPDRPGETEEEQ